MKNLLSRLIIAFLLVLPAISYAKQAVKSQGLSDTEFQITIDAAAHQKFGLYYPVTYSFQIPGGSSNLTAQYRFSPSGSWVNLVERTSADFFNGINAARFDYINNLAYLSIAFSPTSDVVYLRILNGQSEVPLTYMGMPEYYDNRHAAVTVSLDDWEPPNTLYFVEAAQFLSNAHVHFTVAIITGQSPLTGLSSSNG